MRQSVSLEIKKVKASTGKVYSYHVLRWHDPATGKRRSETLGRVDRGDKTYITLTEAKKRRDLKAAEFHGKPDRRGSGHGLSSWIDQYIRQRRSEGLSERTLELTDAAGRMLLRHFAATTDIRSIQKADARRFLTSAQEGSLWGDRKHKRPAGESRQTLAKYLRQIHTIFNRAVADDLIDANPFTKMTRAKPEPSVWSYVTLEDFWKVCDKVPYGVRQLFILGRLAALTREDALTLTWGQVDMKARHLKIKRQKTRVDQQPPLDLTLMNILTQWRKERGSIPTANTQVIQEEPYLGNIGRDFKVWCRKAGVIAWDKPCHDLRKSCIHDWVRIQPSAQVLKLWAGHAAITTTLTYYDKVQAQDMAVGQGRIFTPPPVRTPKTAPNPSA